MRCGGIRCITWTRLIILADEIEVGDEHDSGREVDALHRFVVGCGQIILYETRGDLLIFYEDEEGAVVACLVVDVGIDDSGFFLINPRSE